MTIECYYNQCCFHSQDGPFCDESECQASEQQRNQWEEERQEKLAKCEYNIPEPTIEKMSQEIKEHIDKMVLQTLKHMNEKIEDILRKHGYNKSTDKLEIRNQPSSMSYSYYINDKLILVVRVLEGGFYEIHEYKSDLNILKDIDPNAEIIESEYSCWDCKHNQNNETCRYCINYSAFDKV